MSTMPGPQHGYLHCSSNQSHDGTQTPNQPQTRTSVLAQETTLDRIFLLGLLAAILYVLWLPVFPTGDGPVHLYYADVLWSLVQHQPTYAHDYAIRHLLAPYLVHYLALVSFEDLVPPPMSEKLFIAIIFLTQASPTLQLVPRRRLPQLLLRHRGCTLGLCGLDSPRSRTS